MDLAEMTLVELKNSLQQLPAEIERRERVELARLVKDVQALAVERGVAIAELLAALGSPPPTRGAKYRHPQKLALSWVGRGPQPKWMTEYIAQGGTLEELRVR